MVPASRECFFAWPRRFQGWCGRLWRGHEHLPSCRLGQSEIGPIVLTMWQFTTTCDCLRRDGRQRNAQGPAGSAALPTAPDCARRPSYTAYISQNQRVSRQSFRYSRPPSIAPRGARQRAEPQTSGRPGGLHKVGGWVGRTSHHREASPLPAAPRTSRRRVWQTYACISNSALTLRVGGYVPAHQLPNRITSDDPW
jgi:hypothetical protein